MSNVPPSTANAKNACQCQCNKTPWWKIALEVGAVVVGIAVWVIYYLQLDVMQNTLRAEQRAWIGVQGMPNTPEITDGKPISSMVRIMNTGKTPAKDITAHVVTAVVKNGKSPDFEWNSVHSIITTGVVWPNEPRDLPAVIFMQDDTHQPLLVTPELRTSLASGQSFIEIYGKIEYVDVFKVHHRTRFCKWYFYTPGNYTAEKCTAYNGIDEF